MPDPGAVYAVLGTLAAHHLNREPVWTLLVAPGGSGKTEILQAAAGLAEVFPAATLTEPALLSGTATKERSKGATGGLLVQIGESGVLLCKDFGSVLSMHRESRGQVLAALREVYDGEWTRHVGVDGGKTLSWRGKIGFIGGCTPTIDRAHAVMASMGERFLLYRLPKAPPNGQAVQALEHAGREADAGIGHSPHQGSQDQHAGGDAHESRGRAARKSERRTLPPCEKAPPGGG